jgi:glycosyltransferase involved in cell wall biosynthesis
VPRVSVVVPAYNAERFLALTLEGVIAQTMSEWELIIVDDASTDGTLEVARRFEQRDPRIRVIERSQNSGAQSVPNNIGLQAADPGAAYVAFLDSDDVWEPDTLEVLCGALAASPAAVAAHGFARMIDEAGEPTGMVFRADDRFEVSGVSLARAKRTAATTFAMLALQNCVPCPGAALIRRSALDVESAWDETLRYCADWDLWTRLSRVGEIVAVDRTVIGYRQHQTQQTREAAFQVAVREQRDRIIASPENSEEQRELALRGAALSDRVTHDRVIRRARRSWALAKLRSGDPIGALREIGRLFASYAH